MASKKVSGRQDNTLAQYIREVTNCRNTLRKNDWGHHHDGSEEWYFGMLGSGIKSAWSLCRGGCGI
ncbi:MAG: hypothetical protein ACLT76_00690 [Clostridium fessum]